MADDLVETLHQAKVTEKKQKQYGLKFIEGGLMFCQASRAIYRPADHCIRDWMHMMAHSGVGNTEIALILHIIISIGVSMDTICEFAMNFNLPKKHGKVQRNWLTDHRLHDDTINSFASVVLTLIPILFCFLTEYT